MHMAFGEAVNFYELLVNEYLTETAAPKAEITDKCILTDVTCIALNMLPARYIRHAIDMSFFLKHEEQQEMRQAAYRAVDLAIETVKNNPR